MPAIVPHSPSPAVMMAPITGAIIAGTIANNNKNNQKTTTVTEQTKYTDQVLSPDVQFGILIALVLVVFGLFAFCVSRK